MGSAMGGFEMSAGRSSFNSGMRRDACEVFGMAERAEAKSCAVGEVRREVRMDVRMACRNSSISIHLSLAQPSHGFVVRSFQRTLFHSPSKHLHRRWFRTVESDHGQGGGDASK